ncbi:hypothetical protein COLO4_31552 [Corchorus olitorius]|uniref:Uncharacterized protein n=1 Tax=Corchorus olitorius TaxID=93759 RepID=A0A1R3H4B1_9ROSI|nr:hypothetical protein COLO4_31552 [Corchorus olitorius]
MNKAAEASSIRSRSMLKSVTIPAILSLFVETPLIPLMTCYSLSYPI